MKNIASIGIQIPDILLPKTGINLQKWAVIACDQFTSEPDYWKGVEKLVGDAPSTYHLILPEVMLGTAQEQQRIQTTQAAMRRYLQDGMLVEHRGMILVERQVDGRTRKGLMLALDLEQYDYSAGSQTLIRATEGTIVDRLPPRMRIREGAELELPHILVLIDDPKRTVIEPLYAERSRLPKIYDFDLMFDSGHLTGYSLKDEKLESQVVKALEMLAEPGDFKDRYGLQGEERVLLFAMGDGNHSLATAKAIWEKNKSSVGLNHPSRYALVEIENVHDEGLEFEPIHRILFGVTRDLTADMQQYFNNTLNVTSLADPKSLFDHINGTSANRQVIGVLAGGVALAIEFKQPSANLAVGSLQPFIDQYLKEHNALKVDYIHGDEVVERLAAVPGNVGFYLPGMDKNELFRTVILDGVLPRKTFSMGEAREKRFYMECRKIV
ncbi:MAG: DUF1015 domain-containing protein [Anaerolineaceae bacterium]